MLLRHRLLTMGGESLVPSIHIHIHTYIDTLYICMCKHTMVIDVCILEEEDIPVAISTRRLRWPLYLHLHTYTNIFTYILIFYLLNILPTRCARRAGLPLVRVRVIRILANRRHWAAVFCSPRCRRPKVQPYLDMVPVSRISRFVSRRFRVIRDIPRYARSWQRVHARVCFVRDRGEGHLVVARSHLTPDGLELLVL